MAQTTTQYISVRVLWWTLLLFTCTAASITAIYVDPLLIIAAVFVLLNAFLIFKYPMYGVVIYLAIFLLRPAEIFPSLAVLRPELLVGGFTLLAVILNQKLTTGKVIWPTDPISLSMLALLVAITLSMITSFEKFQTKEAILDFVKLILFYYLIVCTVVTKRRFVIFMGAFVLFVVYIAFDALKNYLAGEFVHVMEVDRLAGGTSAGGDPNTLASTMAATIPLIVALFVYYRKFLLKVSMAGLSVLLMVLITLTASRGGLLAFLGTLFAAIAYTRQKIVYTICAIAILAVGWVLLPQQYKARYERFGEVAADINEGSSGRWDIWVAGAQMIAQRPILGVGAGAFAWAYGSGQFGPAQWLDPHNVYIQVFATTGIVGLTAWLCFLYYYIKTLKKLARETKYDEEYRWIGVFCRGILIALVALFVSGMFGHNMFRYTWYLMAGLATSMNIIYHNRETERGEAEPVTSKHSLSPANT